MGVCSKQSAGAQRRQRWNVVTTTRRASETSQKYAGISVRKYLYKEVLAKWTKWKTLKR